MRYKVGAEQLQQVPTLLHRPDTAFRANRTAPAGPTHAVSTRTGEGTCGIKAEGLEVLDQDWEEAFFVENSWVFRRRPGRRSRRAGSSWPPMTSWRRRSGAATSDVVIPAESAARVVRRDSTHAAQGA
jgi:hypothetical protein